MCFSHDLIYFSGAQSLQSRQNALKECVNVLMCECVNAFAPQGRRPAKRPQAVSLIWSQAECVNVLMRKCVNVLMWECVNVFFA